MGAAVIMVVFTVLVQMGARREDPRCRADIDRHKCLTIALADHSFGLLDQITKSWLARDPFGIKLFRRRARNNANDVGPLLGALVDDRFDRAQAMADQNEAAVMMALEKFDRAIEILNAVVETFVSGTAEFS